MLVTLACIFASILFCSTAAHAQDHQITAEIKFDTQLGTATIDQGASATVSVQIDAMEGLDTTTPDGTFTYSWGFFTQPPHVTLPSNVNAASNTLSTNFDTAGEYPITFLCDIDFVPASGIGHWHGEAVYYDAIQDVIGGDFTTSGTNLLYYYCGAPVEYDYLPEISAPQQPPGTTWTWKTSSALNVQENTGTSQPDGYVIGVAGSSQLGSDWVQISYSLNGVTWDSPMHGSYTVLKPSTMARISTSNLPAYYYNPNTQTYIPDGYSTEIKYKLFDQLNDEMPSTGVNESFGTFVSDFAGENWPTPNATGKITDVNGQFPDTYHVYNLEGTFQPDPQGPSDPLGTTKVQHGSQAYYAGSSTPGQGCLIETGTLQYYLDHADHEG
jgi:hypothetical protein